MKKLILVALAFAATTSVAYATETPNVVRASLVLTKNGVPVSKIELSMLEGRSSPYSNVTTRNYISECDPASAAGPMESKSSSLKTGMMADVTPLQVTEDGALLSVGFNYSELTGMKTVRSKGCTIEVPTTHNFGNTITVHVKPGQPVELPSANGSDKYVLIVRKL
jgi:hypothetical protein